VLNGLDLFSGIGGISLALRPWVLPKAYCESDRYAQSVLLSRMSGGQLFQAPIWDDVCSLTGKMLPQIDMVYGGFPCQDISAAGRGAGLAGQRSGLVTEVFRLVQELRPAFVFLENVPAIRTRGLGRVVSTMAGLGYDCRWTIVSAQELGAPHIRKRWFLLAHAHGMRLREEQRAQQSPGQRSIQLDCDGTSKPMADTQKDGCRQSERLVTHEVQRSDGPQITKERDRQSTSSEWRPGFWATEPSVGRVADGVPNRLDRLRGLGNAVVPAQAREAFMRLMGIAPAQYGIDHYDLEDGC
jgi:DNA (cytosine-5)-methyltransferase 1